MRYRNAMQRDPNLAKAFDNLAGLFAPPSGSDFLASAKMQSERADAARRAAIFSNPDPAAAAELAARMGIANYGQTRSGFDKSDATVRFNNAADNARMLQTNEADNRARVAVKALDPIAENQVRPEFGSIANMYRIPELAQSARGNISAKPGEIITTPENEVFRGAPQALSVDQAKAAALERMRAAGQLSDQQVVDVILDKTVQARGADGRDRFVAPGAAVREGMSPVPPAPTGGARKDGMALLTDGRRVPITRAPDGLQWQMQDGTPVPPGAEVFEMSKPTATELGIGTGSNQTMANAIDANIAGFEHTLGAFESVLTKNPGVIGAPGNIRAIAQDLVSTVSELSAAFGNTAPNAKVSLDQVKSLAERIAPARDPNIQLARSLALTLAYQDAKLADQGGEVNRQDFERSYEKITGGMLRNNQSALEAIAGMRVMIEAKRKQAQELRRRGSSADGAPAAPAAPAREERWERGPDGKLRPAQ